MEQDRVEVLQKNDALLSSRTIGAYNTESDPNPKSDKRTISCRISSPRMPLNRPNWVKIEEKTFQKLLFWSDIGLGVSENWGS